MLRRMMANASAFEIRVLVSRPLGAGVEVLERPATALAPCADRGFRHD